MVNVHYLPLSFGKHVLQRVELPYDRYIVVSFVGGLGYRHIWNSGQDAITAVAKALGSRFKWAGYGNGPDSAELASCWIGECWGHEYFRTLARSRIALNRHGEVSRGAANNLRLFEATAMGCCLVTEHAPNISDFFDPGMECVTYKNPDDLVRQVKLLLAKPERTREIAEAGRRRCLAEHCYENRVARFLDVIGS